MASSVIYIYCSPSHFTPSKVIAKRHAVLPFRTATFRPYRDSYINEKEARHDAGADPRTEAAGLLLEHRLHLRRLYVGRGHASLLTDYRRWVP
jgi:hypothetical protein